MSSLSAKDRASLCSFTFADGRRCRTPRIGNHPHFCPYHAQKEARAQAAGTLGKDLAYFFSGNYLSACDLSTALARLIPAVLRGDVKPKTAHTVAYLMQTLMQAIHMSQHEYCEAFGSDGWRKSIFNSVKGNHDYRFPPDLNPNSPSHLNPNLSPACPATNPSPTTPLTAHRKPRELSFRAQRGICFFFKLVTSHSPLPQPPQPGVRFLAGHSACPTSPTQPPTRRNPSTASRSAQQSPADPPIHSAQGHVPFAFRPANSDWRDFARPATAPSPTTCLTARWP
jgi:hypothetical protein